MRGEVKKAGSFNVIERNFLNKGKYCSSTKIILCCGYRESDLLTPGNIHWNSLYTKDGHITDTVCYNV